MKRFFALMLSALLLGGCGAGSSEPGYEQISQTEALEIMNTQENYIIVDVRTPEEFLTGHIAGAVNLPNEEIGTEPIPLLPQKDQLILVYCRSGNRSRQASRKLSELGYTNVREFGGINTWTGPVEP